MEVNTLQNLVRVENVSKHYIVKKSFFSPKQTIEAVKNVSFDVYKGETLGLIGESGSGKTTISHLLIKLLDCDQGKIYFEDEDISILSEERRLFFRKNAQIVFQYSMGSLDPLKTIYELLADGLRVHHIQFEGSEEDEVNRLIKQVGLSDGILHKSVRQISGGQKQRVGIARALSTRPKLLVLDEPVSALDVSVQGQIINLLNTLKEQLGLTYIFITHDLDIARHLCDRLAVMYQGEIVEIGKTSEVMTKPENPYTKRLVGGSNHVL